MNELSWPTTIFLGILLGLAAVAAERQADAQPEAAGSETSATQSPAPAEPAPAETAQTNPDTGRPPAADDYVVTLTFDDGPHPIYTPQVLELLKAHDAVAVFCVVGERVRDHPELVQQVVDAGHALCNHTTTHDERLAERDPERIEYEIGATNDAIASAVDPDVEVRYFRQPNVFVRPEVKPALEAFGLRPLDWDIDPRDWSAPGSTSIVQNVLGEVHPGAVILLHDGGGDRSQTVTALAQILDGLDAAGYRYVLPGDS